MKIFNHPVHVMLVHFPIALIPTSLFFDTIAYYQDDNQWAFSGFILLTISLVAGIFSLIFGFLDLIKIPIQSKAFQTAFLHATLNCIWLIIWGVIFGIRFIEYPAILVVQSWYLVLLSITVLGLIYSNYLGGQLILKHNIGHISDK